jgi:hypothetical protein
MSLAKTGGSTGGLRVVSEVVSLAGREGTAFAVK